MRIILLMLLCIICLHVGAEESDQAKIDALELRVYNLELDVLRLRAERLELKRVIASAEWVKALTVDKVAHNGEGLTVTLRNAESFRVPDNGLDIAKTWTSGDVLCVEPSVPSEDGALLIFVERKPKERILVSQCPYVESVNRLNSTVSILTADLAAAREAVIQHMADPSRIDGSKKK